MEQTPVNGVLPYLGIRHSLFKVAREEGPGALMKVPACFIAELCALKAKFLFLSFSPSLSRSRSLLPQR